MFENLTERLNRTLKNLRGQGRLTEENIQHALRDVRRALLEADVALPVVKRFIERVKSRAIGREVSGALNPGQAFIKIVDEELTRTMGGAIEPLNMKATPPVVILMAGLQGAGKTTTVGKLAKWLKEREKKKVMVVSADVYRPAAMRQLQTLAEQAGAAYWPASPEEKPERIVREALQAAKKQFADVLIVDTAGRLHVDEEMMDEIKRLHAVLNPTETLFVVDAMTGQDAANTAKAFHEALPLTGVVLTKADGDARGGAALSIREITGKPIKFLGVGEKLDGLEPFHPDRMASRILDMGDMLSLIEEAEARIDRQKAERFARKVQKSGEFDLEDFREQLGQIHRMGGISGLMGKLPGMGQMAGKVDPAIAEREFKRMEAIVNSMTPQERRYPNIIKGSRKRRIARGAGVQVQDVNRLLKQFEQMRKMMKKLARGGMKKLMRGMGGQLPGGMGGGLPGLGGGLPFGRR